MCDPVVGTWVKFILKNGQVVIGRVTILEDDLITIDNAEPVAGGYHRSFVFSKAAVLSCGPADSQKDVYTEGD